MRLQDLTGKRFGRWEVIRRASTNTALGRTQWMCRCDCGSEGTVPGEALRGSHSKSCGCFKRDNASRLHGKHRQTGTPEYRVWHDMRRRCFNPKNKSYRDYGARGITVCDRWNDFETFIADMGPRPSPKHTIDRKDNDGNYEPGNCRWETRLEQANNKTNNRHVVYRGQKITVPQAIRMSGNPVQYKTVMARLYRGWSIDRALEPPSGVNSRGDGP